MTVFIDALEWKKSNSGKETYAHMVAESYDELHKFAAKIGLGRHFFHSKARYHHYDVSSKFYQKAVDAGAFVVDSRRVLAESKFMMGNSK